MMQAGECELLIQLDMEELSSEKTVTTFRFIKPKGDILTQLRQCIDNELIPDYMSLLSEQNKQFSRNQQSQPHFQVI